MRSGKATAFERPQDHEDRIFSDSCSRLVFRAGACGSCLPPAVANLQLGCTQQYDADVEDNWHRKFKLTLFAPCQNLPFHQRLAIKTFGETALSCVSRGDEILSGTEIGPQTCPITKIEAYTPEMEKADKAATAAAKPQRIRYQVSLPRVPPPRAVRR